MASATYRGIASEASAESSQVATGPGRLATVRWRPAQSRFRPVPEPLRTAGAPASCWSATAAERSTSGGLLGARRPRGLVRSRVWGRGAQVVERQTGHAHDVARRPFLHQHHALQVLSFPSGAEGQLRGGGEDAVGAHRAQGAQGPYHGGVAQQAARIFAPADLLRQAGFGQGQQHIGRLGGPAGKSATRTARAPAAVRVTPTVACGALAALSTAARACAGCPRIRTARSPRPVVCKNPSRSRRRIRAAAQ